MVDTIAVVAQSTIILAFGGGLFSYMVLKPLNKSIADLQSIIDTIKVDVKEIKERQRDNELELTKTSASASSAHKRIDTLEGRVNHEN